MLPGPVGLCKLNNFLPFKGLISALGVEPELLYRRLPHDANRRGLRRLVAEEIDILVEAIAADAAFNGANVPALIINDCTYIATVPSDVGSGTLGTVSESHQRTNMFH